MELLLNSSEIFPKCEIFEKTKTRIFIQNVLKIFSVVRRVRKQWVKNCLLTLHYFLTFIVNLCHLANYCLSLVIRQISLVLCHEKTGWVYGLMSLRVLDLKAEKLSKIILGL